MARVSFGTSALAVFTDFIVQDTARSTYSLATS